MHTKTIERPAGREGLAEYYGTILEEQRRSGLSVAEAAKAVGVTPATLYQWRRRLAGPEESAAAGERSLVRVRVAGPDDDRREDYGARGYVVRLRGDRAIEVPGEFDGAELARLVGVLESC